VQDPAHVAEAAIEVAPAAAEGAHEVQEAAPPDPLVLPAGDERWEVLYTHSRCEKQVAHACTYLDITHYLPLRQHWTGSSRRRRYLVPLFPSYVFACPAPGARAELLGTGKIARVIHVDDPAVLLDELRQIRVALDRGADLFLGRPLQRGERVRVVRGPFKGVEGMVTAAWRRRRRLRLVLNVSAVGQSVSVNVDAAQVERDRTRVEMDGGQ
jgi:hypothetical protein